jgi:DNA polymerase III epsilon subunit-like protein
MARKKWPGGRNNLKSVCSKLGIEWDGEKAHRASYDVEQCIKVFVALKHPNGIEYTGDIFDD